MVQTGMTTPYTAFAQQNGGPAGDTSVIKAADMKGVDGGGPGGGGGSPPNAAQQALQALHQSAQHANGVVDQQNATVSKNYVKPTSLLDKHSVDIDCSIYQIFREINFGESKSAK